MARNLIIGPIIITFLLRWFVTLYPLFNEKALFIMGTVVKHYSDIQFDVNQENDVVLVMIEKYKILEGKHWLEKCMHIERKGVYLIKH